MTYQLDLYTLPINVEDLLRQIKVEYSRIELKKAVIRIESTILSVRLPTISKIVGAYILIGVEDIDLIKKYYLTANGYSS